MVTVSLCYPPSYQTGCVLVVYDPDIYVTGSWVVCSERGVFQLSEPSFRAQFGALEAELLNVVVRQSAWSCTVCLCYPPPYQMGRVLVVYDPDISVTGSRVVYSEREVSQLSESSSRAQFGVLEAELLNVVVRQSSLSQYVQGQGSAKTRNSVLY